MTTVRLDNITKTFGSTVALANINLTINAGELFFLLGPSGCGKSTLLRLIAGLHEPTAGRIFFNDRDVTPLQTRERNAVMCFQSYALWPHMSVRENVRFGLAVRKADAAEQARRVEEVLSLVRMLDLADRKPNQLSGGQQQRVALARALAVKPACLLLDEPLSNLDAKLRHEMRTEIRRICTAAGFTTIYVTHDQKEALSIADRIAVMNAGKLAQVGTPDELYHRPASAFVAEFIGNTNLIPGEVIEQVEKIVRVRTAMGEVLAESAANAQSRNVTLSIRPEQLELLTDRLGRDAQATNVQATKNGRNRVVGRPVEMTFLGEASEHVVDVNGTMLKVISTPPRFGVPPQVAVEFDARDVVILPE
jgi:iron(III) transport system ATP-binding protein